MFPDFRIQEYLNKRKQEHTFRTLSLRNDLIDFSSNDYLGLSRSAYILQCVQEDLQLRRYEKQSATGSRLLNGNSELYEKLESFLADFHHAEAALVFNSGFDANVGLLSTVARPGDVIYYDELVHASIHEGLKLSGAELVAFKHNDAAQLESLVKNRPGFIVTESVFSMEGDKAPLKELANLAKKYQLAFIVDEAHATGLFGENGSGLCNEAGIEKDCFARVYTFGKALGSHGAAVVGSTNLKEYLVNFCKPFIYSTALETANLLRVEHAYKFLQTDKIQRNKLFKLNSYFTKQFYTHFPDNSLRGEGPVFGLIYPENKKCRELAAALQAYGFDVRPILSPTVAKGTERLRISLHSYNSTCEVDQFLTYLKQLL